jgi:serine/threonine protein phosphatase 1
MKYYVTADVHGYCTLLQQALTAAGYFEDTEPHKLVILGDLLDRGEEACQVQDFVLRLMEQEQVILIKGNHEELFEALVTKDRGLAYRHHVLNGTFDTALQLTGFSTSDAGRRSWDFAYEARRTPFYKQIIPSMLDFFETEHYVFVHGWIPCDNESGTLCFRADWRSAGPEDWASARWLNGIEAAQTCREQKTVLCGHWHASYGHAKYEHKGSEYGPDADFSPYRGPGIIALDACTAISGRVNVLLLED